MILQVMVPLAAPYYDRRDRPYEERPLVQFAQGHREPQAQLNTHNTTNTHHKETPQRDIHTYRHTRGGRKPRDICSPDFGSTKKRHTPPMTWTYLFYVGTLFSVSWYYFAAAMCAVVPYPPLNR